MIVTRLQQQTIDDQNQQFYLFELNRLGNIEIEQTFPTQPVEVFIARRPILFEMTEKLLASRISKQLDQGPTFSGKLTENVTKWLKDITNELNLVKFDDGQKLNVIQTYLIDDARKWFINNMETFNTWSEFNVAITQMYSSTFAKEAAISQVAQRNQGLDETVIHYYNEMIDLFNVMDNQISDLLKVSYLKHGLKLSLKKEVSRKNPQTPSAFLKAAQEEENLDASIDASMGNWEMSNKNGIQPRSNTTAITTSPLQQNDYCMSFPEHSYPTDGENYYAGITASNKQYRSQQQRQQQQQQPYRYQQQQQQQPYVYQQQQPYVNQQQHQQSYPYQTQQRCYRCSKIGHFARDCRYSKN